MRQKIIPTREKKIFDYDTIKYFILTETRYNFIIVVIVCDMVKNNISPLWVHTYV